MQSSNASKRRKQGRNENSGFAVWGNAFDGAGTRGTVYDKSREVWVRPVRSARCSPFAPTDLRAARHAAALISGYGVLHDGHL